MAAVPGKYIQGEYPKKPPHQQENKVCAKVLFDYTAEQEDEISLKVGDIVINIIKEDEGWWYGETNGKSGMFPENFVAIVKPGDVKTQVVALKAEVKFDYNPEQEDELGLEAGSIIDVTIISDEGWWKGTWNGKSGMFPSNFVQLLEDGKPKDAITKPIPIPDTGQIRQAEEDVPEKSIQTPETPPEKPSQPQSKMVNMFAMIRPGDLSRNKLKKVAKEDNEQKSNEVMPKDIIKPMEKPMQMVPPMKIDNRKEMDKIDKKVPLLPVQTGASTMAVKPAQKAKALFDYEPEQADELRLVIGQIFTVTDNNLFDGWMRGEINGVSGVFPDNFVELLPLENSSGGEHLEISVGEGVRDEAPKPRGISMFPQGSNPLQNELAKKLAQKSSPGGATSSPPVVSKNKAPPPPLPETKPKPLLPPLGKPLKPLSTKPIPTPNKPLLPKTDSKPQIPKNNSVPTLPQKPDSRPVVPLLPKTDSKPLVQALPTKPPPPPAFGGVKPSSPGLPKNDKSILPNTDAKTKTPDNETNTNVYSPSKKLSADETKSQIHSDRKPGGKPNTLFKSTSFSEESSAALNSELRRSFTAGNIDQFKDPSTEYVNLKEHSSSADALNKSHEKVRGLPCLDLDTVKPTDPLKHVQRAKPPSKSPPGKYKDKKYHLDQTPIVVDNSKPKVVDNSAPKLVNNSTPKVVNNNSTPKVVNNNSTPKVVNNSTPKVVNYSTPKVVDYSTPNVLDYSTPKVVDNSHELNELKSQVTDLQNKMSEMEIKFKRLLNQVTNDLDEERKQRLSQQVEIERLSKKLEIFS